ncbi:uncharacterized protein BN805_01089 [Prevotella sp. CAG:891]|nr:uncharacterized protein BN805_01089 [Prevotella sp. CAG:891]
MTAHYKHTIRRKWLHLCSLFLCTGLLTAACSNNIEEASGGMASIAPTIQVEVSTSTLNANDHLVDYPDTTTLMSTQHVTHVMLYIFKGSDETAEYCGQFEEVKWKEHFTANGGMLPIHSARMNHRLKTQLERNTPYQFLAVGTNDEGHETFNVPLNPSAEGQKGTTLTEALGKLKETATVQKIRRSEIFVGLKAYHPENHIATRITLRRRVAGVAGWFKNVPAEVATPLTQGVTDRRLSKLRIALYTAQNTVLPLIKRQQKPDFEDFIASASSAADATTLVEIPITPDNTSKGIEQTFTGGSFVLPIPAPADKEKYTLRIELVNKEGQVLDVRRAKLPKNDELDHGSTGGGTGIIDTESAYRFPIVANHYYGLGSPHKPIDLKGSGADLTITVDPTWNEEADLELGEKN